ncbi:MAG: hypothetical protein DRQ64_00225 [Gammaproteobacteria bacterium]|nr:MAG: hypothetical protein DRQ64_00225 [Gammaproteobacteria bacterium]
MKNRDDNIHWWDWVIATATELRDLGVHPDEVSELRNQKVGLRKPLSKRWARTVGLWGGQKTCAELAGLIGVSRPKVRSYAGYWGIGFLKRGSRRLHQVEVALGAEGAKRHYGNERTIRWMAATGCHILPPEYIYYTQQVPLFEGLIKDTEGLTLPELLEEYELGAVQEMWVASKSALTSPWGDDEEDDHTKLLTRLRS